MLTGVLMFHGSQISPEEIEILKIEGPLLVLGEDTDLLQMRFWEN